MAARTFLRLPEITACVRFDHGGGFIVNANHNIM
jgi:hypothetical protein